MDNFDCVVSIGYNCEASFRIRNYFGALDSQLYSWAYIYDRDRFLDSFEHPEKIFSRDMFLTETDMFECELTGVRFHPRHEVLEDKSQDEKERVEWCKKELKDRVNHLIDKHKKLFIDSKKILFILKVKPQNIESDIIFIKRVFHTIERMHSNGIFTLVVVLPKNKLTSDFCILENERLKIRSIAWFAPQKHTDIASDFMGWGRIFREFCGGNTTEYFKREMKQKYEIIPGMVKHKLKKFAK